MMPNHIAKLDLEIHNTMMWLVLEISKCILNDGCHLTMKDIHYVPQLPRSLIFVRQLNDNSYKVIPASQSFCRKKGNIIIAKGNKVGSLYPLFIHQKEHRLVLTDQPMTCIWHGHLGYMSQNGIKNYFP